MHNPSERSVNEILQAIQKVIERDHREAAQAPEAPVAEDSVLLNADEGETDAEEFLVSDEAEIRDDDILDLGAAATALMDDGAEAAPEPPAKPKSRGPIPPERIIAQIEETLTSEGAADAMRRSLSNLSRISETSEPAPAPSGETTIEQLVRDMLRPLLAQWLDTNLPPLVEKLVKDEIARIAGKRS